MELFRIHKTIPFMKYSKILNAISFISFFIAIGLLVVRGLAFSIEFTGGLVMEVNYPDAVPVQELRVDLEKATGGVSPGRELRYSPRRSDPTSSERQQDFCSDERRGHESHS